MRNRYIQALYLSAGSVTGGFEIKRGANMNTIIDKWEDRENQISFTPSEVNRIRENFKKGHIREAYKVLLKEDKEWQEVYEKRFPRYYRKECAVASDHPHKRGDENPVIIILRDDISSDENFAKYFGVDKEGFFEYVANRDFLVLFSDINKYEKNPYLKEFFEEWSKNDEVESVYPIYANRLENVLVKDKGYDNWVVFLDELKKKYKRFDKLKGKKLSPVGKGAGRLELRGDAFSYFTERIAWFELLEYQPIIRKIEDLLDEYLESGNSYILEKAKNFTFSMFEILGAYTFYSRGNPQNMSINDLDRIYRSIMEISDGKILQTNEDDIRKSINPIKIPMGSKDKYVKSGKIKIDADSIKNEKEIYRICREKEKIDYSGTQKYFHEIDEAILGKNYDVIDIKKEKLEEALNGLSSQFESAFSRKYDVINLGISSVISLVEFPIISQFPIISLIFGITSRRIEMMLKEYLMDKKTVNISIPAHIWQAGFTDEDVKTKLIHAKMFIR